MLWSTLLYCKIISILLQVVGNQMKIQERNFDITTEIRTIRTVSCPVGAVEALQKSYFGCSSYVLEMIHQLSLAS